MCIRTDATISLVVYLPHAGGVPWAGGGPLASRGARDAADACRRLRARAGLGPSRAAQSSTARPVTA